MTDYLETYKKFKEVKEVEDYINDVITLRYYYSTNQFKQMWKHINELTNRYFIETKVWNKVNSDQPQTYEQAYINAENFLQMQGAVIIAKKVKNYTLRLTEDEMMIIKSLIEIWEKSEVKL